MKSAEIRAAARQALGDAPAVTSEMVAALLAQGVGMTAARKHLTQALAERESGMPIPVDRRDGIRAGAGRPVVAASFAALVSTVERRAAKVTARQISPEQAALLAQRLRAAADELERVTEHRAISPSQQHEELLAAAHQLLRDRSIDVNGRVPLQPLADALAVAQRCTPHTAQIVMAKAIRQARGMLSTARKGVNLDEEST